VNAHQNLEANGKKAGSKRQAPTQCPLGSFLSVPYKESTTYAQKRAYDAILKIMWDSALFHYNFQ
jgi:hypothetical protein